MGRAPIDIQRSAEQASLFDSRELGPKSPTWSDTDCAVHKCEQNTASLLQARGVVGIDQRRKIFCALDDLIALSVAEDRIMVLSAGETHHVRSDEHDSRLGPAQLEVQGLEICLMAGQRFPATKQSLHPLRCRCLMPSVSSFEKIGVGSISSLTNPPVVIAAGLNSSAENAE